MNTFFEKCKDFFMIPFKRRTFLNLLYLLLTFPLGIFDFTFLATGISLGLGLLIVWIGLPILAGVLAAWYSFCKIERKLAIELLQEKIHPVSRISLRGKNVIQKLGLMAANPVTWKGLIFLLAKLPIGIINLTLVAIGLSLSIGFIAAPFYYQNFSPVIDLTFNETGLFSIYEINSLEGALLVAVIGVIIFILCLHLFNGLAWLSAKFAKYMLGDFRDQNLKSIIQENQT